MSDEKPKMGIDDFTLGCWDLCDDDETTESDGWIFGMHSDQWFVITAECGHKKFIRAANYTHIEESLAAMFEAIKTYHNELEQ